MSNNDILKYIFLTLISQ